MNPLGWFDLWRGQRRAAHAAARQARLLVTNPARQTVLATRMEVAGSAARRSKGLLGRTHLATGEGLWIVPCEAVHTFAMQFPIDLVYIDKNHRVRKLCNAVPPWRLSACLSAHSVLELPEGTIRLSRTEKGDVLALLPAEDGRGGGATSARS